MKHPRPTATAVLAQRRLKDALARRRSRDCVDRLEDRPDSPSRITDLSRELARTGAGADPRLAHLASELLVAISVTTVARSASKLSPAQSPTPRSRPPAFGVTSSRGASKRQQVRLAGHFTARPRVAQPASYFQLRARVKVTDPSIESQAAGRPALIAQSRTGSVEGRAVAVVKVDPATLPDFEAVEVLRTRRDRLWTTSRVLTMCACLCVGVVLGLVYPSAQAEQEQSANQAGSMNAPMTDNPEFVAANALIGYVPDEVDQEDLVEVWPQSLVVDAEL